MPARRVQLLSRDEIRDLVPDLELDDILFGVLGPSDGYAAPREVLKGFRHAAQSAGAEFVHDEVTGVESAGGRVQPCRARERCVHRHAVGRERGWPMGRTALPSLAGVNVPVQPMRQMLFRASLPHRWPHRFPMVIDPGGVHWRHDDPVDPDQADRIIVAFTKWDEPIGEHFEPLLDRWDAEFLPALVRRLPAFRALSNVEGWAGLYEMTPDHNPVLGEHPQLKGFVVANGFSGHGLMMSPATGKIVSEIVCTGASTTFDISIFAADRFERGAPVHDAATI